jgi:maltooligosyltrehalose trehalohydrolase
MHIGTYTHEGKWSSAAEQLEELANFGISVIEIMPVGDFAGRFGWGYDGVNIFAPTRHYGTPDNFRAFVNKAHSMGVGIILDVVYNHLGPEGNYIPVFSDDYFSEKYTTDWGQPFNFDGRNSGPVREYILSNVEYWIREFHIDGFRIDATQNIYDSSREHILREICKVAEKEAGHKNIYIVAENEPQLVDIVKPLSEGGYGYDALWNDDFHHSAMVALTGRNEAYYLDYLGKPQEFISAAKWGYLYQGQWYKWQGKRRGTPTFGLKPENFINFIQNHDQLANSASGLRAHQLTSPGQYKSVTALMILMPGIPMIFQGQEFASSSPFFFFSDHRDDIAKGILQGRAKFLAQFRSLAVPEMQAVLPDPSDPETFVRSKLNLNERELHKHYYIMHRDLLKLKKHDPAFSTRTRIGFDGAVLGEEAFVFRYFLQDSQGRLLVINLGLDLHLDPAPEPLLAPPLKSIWEILWSSEDPHYGGRGTAPLDEDDNWRIPGRSAVILYPVYKEEKENG